MFHIWELLLHFSIECNVTDVLMLKSIATSNMNDMISRPALATSVIFYFDLYTAVALKIVGHKNRKK